MGKNRNIVSYYAPDDVVDILETIGNKSEFITLAIRSLDYIPIKHTVIRTGIIAPPEKKTPQKAPRKKDHPSVLTAWNYYLDKTGSTRTLTDARRGRLNSRLNELGPEVLKKAMDYLLASPFHNGDNDRKWKWDIDFLIRNQEQVEKFAELYQEAPKRRSLEEMFNAQ